MVSFVSLTRDSVNVTWQHLALCLQLAAGADALLVPVHTLPGSGTENGRVGKTKFATM